MLDTLIDPIEFFAGKYSFLSIENDSSKQVSKTIKITKPEETATLFLNVETVQDDFLVQLLATDNKIAQAIRNTKKMVFKNLIPGQYKIRIVFDANKNNHWDPGNIYKDMPPETTFYFQNTDGTYLFPLRANWELGPYTIRF
jgi:uncharacterized protein (DUF2141 family)